jgi:hypothetical protein
MENPLDGLIVPSADQIIYIAGPYTHADALVRKRRFELVTIAAAKLIAQKYIVYSPLTMTHPLDLELAAEGETLGSDYWIAFDRAFMRCCAAIVVVKFSGWEQSRGVKNEIAFFEEAGKPVIYLSPTDLDMAVA